MTFEFLFSGILFYLVIVLNISSNFFGYKTFGKVDSLSTVSQINEDHNKFKYGFSLILSEHFTLIILVIMLFIAFNQYSIILASIWLIARSLEAIIQIYNKTKYWQLLNISIEYATADENRKKKLLEVCNGILVSKNSNFNFSQLFFAIGTFCYSYLFTTINLVPDLIGWFGVIASIIYFIGNAIEYVQKSNNLILGKLIKFYRIKEKFLFFPE